VYENVQYIYVCAFTSSMLKELYSKYKEKDAVKGSGYRKMRGVGSMATVKNSAPDRGDRCLFTF
jgi:hypothetical protein